MATQDNVTVLNKVNVPSTVDSGKEVDASFEYTAISDDESITIDLNPAEQFSVEPPSIPAPRAKQTLAVKLTFKRASSATQKECTATFTLGGSETIRHIEVKK